MKRTSRGPSKLSSSLQRSLNAYALAASAGGVGVLALVQLAESKIIYRPANHQIDTRHPNCPIDFNHDGRMDFSLRVHYTSGGPFAEWLSVFPNRGNAAYIVLGQHSNELAWPLSSGVQIGSKGPFPSNVAAFMASGGKTFSPYGPWANLQGSHYLGLKFKINGKTHYGWATLGVEVGSHVKATLFGYAYETIPNKPIIAGKTKGKDVITIQPASLGHLAHGASAIPAWRTKP